MDFDTFALRAEEMLRRVPPRFLAGIVGIEVHRRAAPHPDVEDCYTLGECVDDQVTSFTDPEAMRSRIHLYFGSFVALSRLDPDFGWEAEIRETLLHEIRHHLEDRAGIPDLLREDALEEALARRDLRDGSGGGG